MDDTSETNVVKKAKTQKSGLISETKKPTTKGESFSFASSDSAMPAGPTDQWAAFSHEKEDVTETTTADTKDDKDNKDNKDKAEKDGGKQVYQGLKAYKKHEKTPRWKRQAGPTKYSSNVRITCRFDYQPDICKDYKETGYCGYGDSCKFLHDRGDYKTGWQLEQEFDQEEKQRREAALLGKEYQADKDEYFVGSDSEEEQGLPFACLICRQPFTDPVVTKCKHYFCENCAIENYKKDPRCFACKENTFGIFNVAKDIIKKQKEDAAKAAAQPPVEEEPTKAVTQEPEQVSEEGSEDSDSDEEKE